MSFKVKFKKLVPEAELPTRGTDGSSGYDIKAISGGQVYSNEKNEDVYYYIEYKTGLAMEVPPGYEVQARMRSSVSKTALILCNGLATIDSDYRGEIICRFRFDHGTMAEVDEQNKTLLEGNKVKPAVYHKGDKIIQLVFMKVEHPEIEEAAELGDTVRGKQGFGSTGK